MKDSTSVAQDAKNVSPQRWTIRGEYIDQPLGCIVDYFWNGFEVGQRICHDSVGYMEIKGFEVLPEDVIDALVQSEAATYLYAMHDVLCLPMHWLEPVTGYEYDTESAIANEVAA